MNQKIIDDIKNQFDEVSIVKTTECLFSHHVRNACEQNQCGCWGKNWRCPPASGSIEELKALVQSYSNMLLFTKVVKLVDSFDVEAMDQGRKEFTKYLRFLNHTHHLTTNHMMILGVGGCDLCQPCSYPKEECRYPEDSFMSLEATGIDVVALAKSASLKYYHGPNTVTYFAAILYNEEHQ